MTGRLFIFGLGYCGLEIAKLARAAGWRVAGTCRTSDKADELNQQGFEAHLFDGTAALPAAAFGKATHVLCTIAPGLTGDPALKTSARVLREARWLGYLSTTGVYGDHGGGWVDEETPARPAQPRSVERLATERAWQATGVEAGSAVDIFRLPGIYGPGRCAIDQVKAGTARRIDKPGQVFSRIHVDDIAATLAASLEQPNAGAIYNVADDLPAPSADVVDYACELLDVAPPPLVPFAEVESSLSLMGREFYADTRRVKNERIKRELGVTLAYPTYREGLRGIVEGERALDRIKPRL
jgi:nucleoside-diphosphate-sugar epimerase